jgi:hypothetical protein
MIWAYPNAPFIVKSSNMESMNFKKHIYLTTAFSIMLALQGCGVYSFTGASISPDIKTLSVQFFFNNASLGPSNMSVLFTENIKDYYQQNTSLLLVDEEGDLQLEGTIDSYTLAPVAPTNNGGQDVQTFTSLTRLTITVSAKYVNTKDDTFNFDKKFSFFRDFDQNTEDLNANEQEFIETIFDQIVLDIFTNSVANW